MRGKVSAHRTDSPDFPTLSGDAGPVDGSLSPTASKEVVERALRVAALREAVARGTYRPDARAIAEAMLRPRHDTRRPEDEV